MQLYSHHYRAWHLVPTLVLLCLVLSSCDLFGGGSATPTRSMVKAPLNKQTYTIPEVGIADFDTLDPALAHDPSSISAIQMIYTGLVQLDDSLHVQPQLARSWSVDSDGLTWTFHLKSNLKFSDGTPLTATDVVYSLDRALQPATNSTVAPIYLGLIKDADLLAAGKIPTLIGTSLQTPNQQTVVIVTSKKAAYFPAMLTNVCSYVVEKSIITQYDTKFTNHLSEGGGAGPFKVANYTHGVRLDLVPNPNYYNKGPQLQKVSLLFYHSSDAAYQDYQNKKLDMTGVPLSTYQNDKKLKEFHQVPQLWINYYTMNYLVKPFDNIHIRQAFALAIDKSAIARDIWKGTADPTNHIIPANTIPGYNPKLTGPDGTTSLTGNTTKAKALFLQGLKEDGFASATDIAPIKLTYVSGVPTFDQEVAALVQKWKQVLNVTVTPDPVDSKMLLDQVTAATNNPNGLQMWGLAWIGEYPDPQNWLSLQFGKGSPNNNMNYGQNTGSNAAAQQVVQQQLDDADAMLLPNQQTARLQSYQQAEQQIVNDVGWLPMEQVSATFLRTTTIVGIHDNAQSIIPPDDWANIYRVQ